jgi:hypothetical protein
LFATAVKVETPSTETDMIILLPSPWTLICMFSCDPNMAKQKRQKAKWETSSNNCGERKSIWGTRFWSIMCMNWWWWRIDLLKLQQEVHDSQWARQTHSSGHCDVPATPHCNPDTQLV